MVATAEPIRNLTEHAGYREAVDRAQNIRSELRKVRQRIDALQTEVNAAPAMYTLEERARVLADGGVEINPGEFAALLNRERLLQKAEQIAERRIEREMLAAQKAIGRSMQPDYDAVIQRLASALLEVGRIADEEAAIREAVSRATSAPFKSGFHANPFDELVLSKEGAKIRRWLLKARDINGADIDIDFSDDQTVYGRAPTHPHQPRPKPSNRIPNPFH